jgi:hypothetical protein
MVFGTMGQRVCRTFVAAALSCAALLSGCVTAPPNYRVVHADADTGDLQNLDPPLLLLPPGTDLQTDVFSVDALRLPTWSLECGWKESPGAQGALSARIVTEWHDGAAAQVFRVSGGRESFASPEALSKAWTEWWNRADNTAMRACLGEGSGPIVRSTLLNQRPRRSADAFEAHFGFHPRKAGPAGTFKVRRAILLRPGMKVCASDAAPTTGNAKVAPLLRMSGGDTCASMVDDPRGGTLFDAAAGRIGGITDPADWAPGPPPADRPTRYDVASWSEVPRDDQPRHYVLIYPRRMPTFPTSVVQSAGQFPLILGVSARRPTSLQIALTCSAETYDEVANLCRGALKDLSCAKAVAGDDVPDDDRPLCFRFGERGIISARFDVFVKGAAVEVPVGSTLGDLINRAAPGLASLEAIGAAAAARADADFVSREGLERTLRRVTLERWFGGRLVKVDHSQVGVGAVALPLMPGDRLSW